MEILGIVLLIAGIITGGILTRMYEKKILRRKFAARLSALAMMYDLMQETLTSTETNLFLIFRTENAGQPIQPGSTIFLTIVHEDYNNIPKGLKGAYQRVFADKGDINTIAELNEAARINYAVMDMPFSRLKKSLMSKGMKHVTLFRIKDTGAAYYFGCIADTAEKAFYNNNNKDTKVDFAISSVRNLFENIKNNSNGKK